MAHFGRLHAPAQLLGASQPMVRDRQLCAGSPPALSAILAAQHAVWRGMRSCWSSAPANGALAGIAPPLRSLGSRCSGWVAQCVKELQRVRLQLHYQGACRSRPTRLL